MLVVSELVIYPVKGCKGIRLQRCALTDAGLQWDRTWMVVTAAGKFVTQARARRRRERRGEALTRGRAGNSGRRASWRW